jgi:ribonucleoside-diphosphate reductase alpha chain
MPSVDISQYPETVELFDGNAQRATVFLDRYSKKGESGVPVEKTPDEMWLRVADAIGGDVTQRARFLNLLRGFKFVPGGRILAGAGIDAQVTYYNCYVIPVETKAARYLNYVGDPYEQTYGTEYGSDSREAIFDTIGLMVDIMSRGGGVGINWSVLRPKGAYLKRVNGTTSGPVSWMDVASRAVGVVEQGGSRRGAAMFMLDDWHPDIEEFIDAKRDFGVITNANVSVAVSDAFMFAVEHDMEWDLVFPDTNHPDYNIVWNGDLDAWQSGTNDRMVKVYKTVRARDLWRKMAEAAWASGEPGVVFLDRYNKLSTAKGVERIISVNPCGEQGLGPYSVCNLGAMNLASYVVPARRSGRPSFDWTAFSNDVADAVEFLDAVIDANYYFIPENEAIQKKLRRIGLGVMGLADALIKLGLRYGDEKAVEFTDRIFHTMKQAALSRSTALAERLGAAPGWEPWMADAPYLSEFSDTGLGDRIRRYGLRNLFLLTQAPTGTTSILAGVNSGIEPYFAFEYTRKDRTGVHRVVAPVVEEYVAQHGEVPLPDYFATSNDVSVEQHIAMQAAAQRHIDSSVSKTINGPNEHTVEDVERAYTLAYKSGLKGIAYFRDGSGRDQVLYKGDAVTSDAMAKLTEERDALRMALDEAQEHLADLTELAQHAVIYKRPSALFGSTSKVRTSAGTAYVTVNVDENGRPVELFVNVGKAGSDIMELGEAIGRLASLSLQSGADLPQVANQLVGIGGNGNFNPPLAHAIGVALLEVNLDNAERRGGGYHDCEDKLRAEGRLDALIDQLEDVFPEPVVTPAPDKPKTQRPSGQMCPECKNFSVVIEEGCKKCHLCGWSAC